mmetsp:Transcript_1702/g.3068  ORF Transcript_1702/g.3068 Transcript_1702/m.3068 type:complete len:111 (+) Transcript_1702:190-522(+)
MVMHIFRHFNVAPLVVNGHFYSAAMKCVALFLLYLAGIGDDALHDVFYHQNHNHDASIIRQDARPQLRHSNAVEPSDGVSSIDIHDDLSANELTAYFDGILDAATRQHDN